MAAAAAVPPQSLMTDEDLAPRPPRAKATSLASSDIEELKSSISGKVVVKGQSSTEELEAANERWNRFFSKPADIITFPKTPEEVSKVVQFVSKHNLDLGITGGRHSYHGASCSDGGLVIDLQNLRNVTVDKEARTVTAGGGCKAEDLEVPAAEQGLHAVFGADNDTGIGGLSTGGGIGSLSGLYGLAVDNILGVQMVLANGDIVNANENENTDLFWAVRGGGNNFGIVTEFKFRAHPHRQPGGLVYFGILAYTPDKTEKLLSTVNRLYMDAVLPQEGRLGIMMALIRPPGAPDHMPAVLVFYDGTEEEAKIVAKPLFDLEPINTMGGSQPYVQTTGMSKIFPAGEYNRHATSGTLMDFPVDEAVVLETLNAFLEVVKKHGDALKKSTFVLEARLGQCAVTSDPTAMAYACRYPRVGTVGPAFQWADPALDDEMRREGKRITKITQEGVRKRREADTANGHLKGVDDRALDAVHPTLNEGDVKVTTMYGPNLPRLRQLKRKYDPDSMFDKWYYIRPAEA